MGIMRLIISLEKMYWKKISNYLNIELILFRLIGGQGFPYRFYETNQNSFSVIYEFLQ